MQLSDIKVFKAHPVCGVLVQHTPMGHRLADVHLAGFAPAFTLSLCDSECSRKPPMPIASVVSSHSEKRKETKITHNRITVRVEIV